MFELSFLTQVLRVYGLPGVILAAVGFMVAAYVRFKMSQSRERQESGDKERVQLISALQAATQQTLQVVRDELRVQQESSVRFFELLDRNTRAMEKMIEKMTGQSEQLTELRTTVTRIEGAVGRQG